MAEELISDVMNELVIRLGTTTDPREREEIQRKMDEIAKVRG